MRMVLFHDFKRLSKENLTWIQVSQTHIFSGSTFCRNFPDIHANKYWLSWEMGERVIYVSARAKLLYLYLQFLMQPLAKSHVMPITFFAVLPRFFSLFACEFVFSLLCPCKTYINIRIRMSEKLRNSAQGSCANEMLEKACFSFVFSSAARMHDSRVESRVDSSLKRYTHFL